MSAPAGAPPGTLPGAIPQIPSPYTTTLVSVIIVFLILATVAVVVRVYSARISSGGDWITRDLALIIAALVVCYGSIIATITGAAVVGLNYFDLTRLSLQEGAQFTFKIYFADVILTTVSSGLCKVSILEFYKRIFITTSFIVMCNIMIFLISAWMIGTFFTQLFSCSPISSAWHPERQLIDANYDYPTALLAIFGIGIVLDFLVLCLPLRPIAKLQLKWSKKLKIYAILWLGIFCAVCASVRFYYAHLQLDAVFVATAQQKAAITVKAALWSKLEPAASIIAACLPTYGPLLKNSNVGSLFKSAASFFSIRSLRSRGSASEPSKVRHHHASSSEEGGYGAGVNHSWHELRPHNYDHETKIEAGSTRSQGEATDIGYIRTTSGFTIAHQGKGVE
ncbi:MAG: hypothetical protein LQ346_003824 [Caloplaca aetnensis]|nr:MAG: hypothetical protein LQ346_003824 [Caloplaca aetnensis]